jgi:peptidyl-prolyl cis-trans isomerase C
MGCDKEPTAETTQTQTATPATEATLTTDAAAPLSTPATSDIAATVCGITLTTAELDAQVEALIQSFPPENAPTADQMPAAREMLKRQVVNSFIQSKLIRTAAEKEKIVITDEAREKAYEEFKVSMGKDIKEELATLKPAMRAIVEDEFEVGILINALIDKNVYATIQIDEGKVSEEFAKINQEVETTTTDFNTYYAALKAGTMTLEELAQKAPRFLPPQGLKQTITTDDMARMPKEIRTVVESTPIGQISEIKELTEGAQRVKFYVVVSGAVAPVTELDALTTINDLKKQLDQGASFEALAATHSACPSGARAGGDLGEFSRGMMVKEFEDATFAQPLNVVGDPIKTSFGYHLIKVTERDEAKGTAKASHILIATKKAGMEVSVVSTILPASVSMEDIRQGLIAREAQPKAYAYLDQLKKDANISCPLYPDLFK